MNDQLHRVIPPVSVKDRRDGTDSSEPQSLSSNAAAPLPDFAYRIRQAKLAARRAPALVEELPPLSESEFERLAQAPSVGDLSPATDEQMPRISGYVVDGEISRGGQAAVFLATQESTGKQVAVKVMAGGPFAGSRHRIRFEREAQILASLDHPNVVSIIERGRTSDGSLFFAMPFISGQTLDEYWPSLPRTSHGLRSLARVFFTIAAAVEEAHCRGVVHRDLKPSNILVDRRGEPHILDFGLARPVEEVIGAAARTITVQGQIIGSLPWASPEQAAGYACELDAASDVYSIGVVLFQALTGVFPYSLQGPIDVVLQRIRQAKVEAPSKVATARPGVDKGLDAIVLKSLSKEPAARYASAGGLSNDLRRWIAGEPLAAKSPKTVGKWVITSAVICLLIVGVIVQRITRLDQTPLIQMPTMTNSVGMTLVKIPAGNLTMGSPESEQGRTRQERLHPERIDRDFWIATTVVTQAEYEQLMHCNPSDARWINGTMPVNTVSWSDAGDYCQELSRREHAHYRLPSEAEFEYACRANNQFSFPDPLHRGDFAYTQENSGGSLHQVAAKRPNAWGLFDMQGNVQQWCADVYTRDAQAQPGGSLSDPFRNIRGGSFMLPLQKARAAARSCVPENSRRPDLGFRVVRDR